VLLAGLLWKKTTIYQAWIAKHLGMKNAANVSRVIHRMGSSQIEKRVSAKWPSLISEKMKENEPMPPVFETGSIDFKKT
jgi:hypothetical protein